MLNKNILVNLKDEWHCRLFDNYLKLQKNMHMYVCVCIGIGIKVNVRKCRSNAPSSVEEINEVGKINENSKHVVDNFNSC